jgi:RimJ/RimL family protein N-acetyltransferase
VDSADAVLIAVRAGGGIVGLGGVSAGSRFVRAGHRAELGISLLAEWCGRGLGTLLMRELVDWARRHPKITVLRLGVFAHNERAIAVYRKVGFEVEGRRRWSVRLADGSYADEVLMSLWTGDSAPGSA